MSVAKPIAEGPSTALHSTSMSGAGTAPRVLVVGDGAEYETIRRILAVKGFEVDGTGDGEARTRSERVAAGGRYALAFVDAHSDGIEMVRELRRADPAVQVVLSVADAGDVSADVIATLGRADGLVVLTKPFDDVEVSQLVQVLSRKWTLEATHYDLEDTARTRRMELERVALKLGQHIVDRSRIESELRLAEQREAVGQVAAGITHEIDTPVQRVDDGKHFLQEAIADLLAAIDTTRKACGALPEIAAYAETVRDTPDGEETAVESLELQASRAFERTLEGVDHVATILRGLTRPEHPSEVEKSPADVNEALASALSVTRNEYEHVAEVLTELGDLPPVQCHIAELSQAFVELIINAAHAIADVVRGTEDKGTIRVRTTAHNDAVRITIADTGGGIPPDVRDRVFDPFFTTKRAGRGTGQGLAIARSIVVGRHGGRLTFQSERGGGTAFTVELPAHTNLRSSHQG